jgi:hypothetical protein
MAIVPFLISTAMLNFFNLGGMMEEVNFILMINLAIPFGVKIFGDAGLYLRWWNKKKLDEFMKTGKGTIFTQKEANETVLRNKFPLGDEYVYVLSTIATGMFFIPIFPFSMIYAVLSLIILYWVDKVTQFLKLVLFVQKMQQTVTILFKSDKGIYRRI